MSSHSETTKPLNERPFSKDELANDVLWNTLGFSKDAVDRVRATLFARDERIGALESEVAVLQGALNQLGDRVAGTPIRVECGCYIGPSGEFVPCQKHVPTMPNLPYTP